MESISKIMDNITAFLTESFPKTSSALKATEDAYFDGDYKFDSPVISLWIHKNLQEIFNSVIAIICLFSAIASIILFTIGVITFSNVWVSILVIASGCFILSFAVDFIFAMIFFVMVWISIALLAAVSSMVYLFRIGTKNITAYSISFTVVLIIASAFSGVFV